MAMVIRDHAVQASATPIPPYGATRRLLWVAVFAATATPHLAGCQESLDVGATNDCGRSIEISVDSFDNDEDLHWTTIASAERAYVASVGNDAQRLYVLVRTSATSEPVEFDVAVEDLPKPPEGVDDDVEVILEGDRCPDPAG